MMRSANKNHNVLAMERGKRRLDFQEEYTLKEGRTEHRRCAAQRRREGSRRGERREQEELEKSGFAREGWGGYGEMT